MRNIKVEPNYTFLGQRILNITVLYEYSSLVKNIFHSKEFQKVLLTCFDARIGQNVQFMPAADRDNIVALKMNLEKKKETYYLIIGQDLVTNMESVISRTPLL